MSSFGVIWIYHITIHNTQKVSTSYSFFFPQRINKNYQVYPLVVEHGQAATSGWCADSKRGRYRLFTRIVDVGMGQKGGDLASNGGNIITPKCNFERNNMWSTHGQTSNFRVCFCFQTKTFISSFGCLQFWKHRRSLLPLEAFAAFGLFCFVVWLASTFCAWQCWRVTTIKNHSLQVVQTCWNASSKAVWSSSREAAQTEHLFTAVCISWI